VFVSGAARLAAEILVNLEVAAIFNGVFETRKSTQSDEIFAKFRPNEARRFAVNQAGINHTAPPSGFHGLLGDATVLGAPPQSGPAMASRLYRTLGAANS
jgi:hypothetical protein